MHNDFKRLAVVDRRLLSYNARMLFINEDPDHFVYSRTAADMTEAGVDALIDGYCDGTAVTDVVINPSASRSGFLSKHKQLYWEGFDPKLGDDQPYFAGTSEHRALIR